MKIVAALAGVLLTIFVVMPIWFFLLYRILQAVNAGELMWFLYWVYLPVTLLVAVLTRITMDGE